MNIETMVIGGYWSGSAEADDLRDAFTFRDLPYRSSEFIHSRSRDEVDEWELAVDRAMRICRTSGLPVERNFKRLYIVSTQGIIRDWMLSALARKLVLLNASPHNSYAARLQMQLLKLAEKIQQEDEEEL